MMKQLYLRLHDNPVHLNLDVLDTNDEDAIGKLADAILSQIEMYPFGPAGEVIAIGLRDWTE